MHNHVHFVAVPEREDAQYLNKRLGRQGHLWQGRFFSCALDEPHAYLAVRYVERNPVRAGLVERPEEYRWSSARGHVGRCADPLVARGDAFSESIPDWSAYLSEGEPAEWRGALRRATLTGRPLGEGGLVKKIEKALGRRLHALAPHRPPKNEERA